MAETVRIVAMALDVAALTDEQNDTLSELAHDAASQLASNAINSGKAVEFLVTVCGWTEQQVIDALSG